MLWTTIAILVGLSLLGLQLQLAYERRWELARWLSGSLAVWFCNAIFGVFIFANVAGMTFVAAKTSLVGSAFLNVILLGLALGARRLGEEVEPGDFGLREIVASGISGISFVGGMGVIAVLWIIY